MRTALLATVCGVLAALAFIAVTHNPRLAQRCDCIVALVDGRIASDRAVLIDDK